MYALLTLLNQASEGTGTSSQYSLEISAILKYHALIYPGQLHLGPHCRHKELGQVVEALLNN